MNYNLYKYIYISRLAKFTFVFFTFFLFVTLCFIISHTLMRIKTIIEQKIKYPNYKI